MKKLIIYLILLAVIIGLGIAVGLNLEDEKKSISTVSENTSNNQTVNKVENTLENTVNNTVDNKVENNEKENGIENEEVETGPADKGGEDKTEAEEEKAINIAKKEWGEDNSVKFSFEEKTADGEYIISVREISTTNALAWYKVNVQEGTCEEW